MTNSEIIAAVERWQADTRVHSLTCQNHNQSDALLKPVEKSGQVMLVCPDCGYCQLSIPDAVLQWDGNLSGFLGIQISP